jgi:hypothetical protein
MHERPAIERPPTSRAFVDQALAELRGRGWGPGAWAMFLRRCGERSAEQALSRALAVVEVTALHLALLSLGGRSRPRLAASWAMAITHLGLLGEHRRSIGPANALSLVRANLPAGRWSPLAAIGTDVMDGWLARLTGPTAYGAYADPLADVVFWTRQVRAREPNGLLRAAAAATWMLPLCAIGAAYLATGRAIDYPRPLLLRRLSAGLQCLLAARALTG